LSSGKKCQSERSQAKEKLGKDEGKFDNFEMLKYEKNGGQKRENWAEKRKNCREKSGKV